MVVRRYHPIRQSSRVFRRACVMCTKAILKCERLPQYMMRMLDCKAACAFSLKWTCMRKGRIHENHMWPLILSVIRRHQVYLMNDLCRWLVSRDLHWMRLKEYFLWYHPRRWRPRSNVLFYGPVARRGDVRAPVKGAEGYMKVPEGRHRLRGIHGRQAEVIARHRQY